MKPYKPKTVTKLTDDHKADRLRFCQWILSQPAGFLQSVIWTDEKVFSLHCRPNKQNERYWGHEDPLVEDECRVQGGPKAMAWAMIVNGTVSVYWFDPGVRLNADSYVEMLQTFMVPRLEEMPGTHQLWYQQDGAPAHTAGTALEWIQDQFGSRVISRLTDIPWPAHSPDLALNDYYLWGVALKEIRRVKPVGMDGVKDLVSTYLCSLPPAEVTAAAENLPVDMEGGHLEHVIKKYKYWAPEE